METSAHVEERKLMAQEDLDAPDSPRCHTAVEGDTCFEHVKWAMERGIDLHPEWYRRTPGSGLTKEDSWFQFQTALSRGGVHDCPPPCADAHEIFVWHLEEKHFHVLTETGEADDGEQPADLNFEDPLTWPENRARRHARELRGIVAKLGDGGYSTPDGNLLASRVRGLVSERDRQQGEGK